MTDLAFAEDADILDDAELALEVDAEANRLEQFATYEGDISVFLTENELTELGNKVVDEWGADLSSNSTWREGAEEGLKAAAQDLGDPKTFPWANASNINYPCTLR